MVGVQKRKIQWAISLFLVMLYFSGLTAQAQYVTGQIATKPTPVSVKESGIDFVVYECSLEDFETGDFSKFPWEHGGDDSWAVTSRQKHSGDYSAKAGAIEDDVNTTLQVTLDCVLGDITFYRKVSCESRCDYLKFYIDGVEMDKWSGEEDWAQVSFGVAAGTRTFEWTYSKDGSDSRGDDTVWIDDIEFPVAAVPKIASNPDPTNGEENVTVPLQRFEGIVLRWTAGVNAVWHDVYFGTEPTPGADQFKSRRSSTYWNCAGPTSGTTYYWRVDEVAADGITIRTGDVWSFTVAPSTAFDPSPADAERFVNPNVTLSCTAGFRAIFHDMYFGDDFADVNASTADTFKGQRAVATYTPGPLANDTTYYWRIDEFDGVATHKGDVWSFTTTGSVAPQYYVATDGNDGNPGTVAKPLKTIAKARDAIRYGARPLPAGGVTVWIRGGTYYLDEPLTFGPADSGTENCSIIYQAYPGENPVISGGCEITGWQRDEGNQNLWRVTLPEVAAGTWWFRQLWCDGERCQRARWPNPGRLLEITAVSSVFLKIRLDRFVRGSDLPVRGTELVVYHYFTFARGKIARKSGYSVTTKTVCGTVGSTGDYSYSEPEYGKAAFLEHHPDYIDQATEWHLDPASGVLTYQAPPDVDPNNCTFVAPKLEKLIIIRGAKHDPVRNIVLKGLSFKHTGWSLPEIGYCGGHGGYRDDKSHPKYAIPPAIEMSYADRCSVERCYVANIADTAVGFGAGCNDNQVVDCEFYDIGGNGVEAGWMGDPDSGIIIGIGRTSNDTPLRNTISNNYLHNIANEWFACVGIEDRCCKHTKIVHNIITNLPYAGIWAGVRHDLTPYVQEGVIIQQNHIYDVMKELNDGGCICTNGNHRGGLISGNLLHDVKEGWRVGFAHQNHGIFFDGGSSNIHVENNITYNIPPGRDKGPNLGNPDMYLKNNTFGTNYWNSPPDRWGATEQAIAAAAGVMPAEPKDLTITLSEDGNCILVTGSCEPWAEIHTAKIQEDNYDVTGAITIEDNGAIQGVIPMISISTNTVTLELVISDPEGDLSSPGVSNTLALAL